MVDLVEHTEVGSPMKVLLQAHVAHECKAGISDSWQSSALGEETSTGIDGFFEYAMPYTSMENSPIGSGLDTLPSPENYSDWQWDQSDVCAQHYCFYGAGQHAALQIPNFEQVFEPQFGNAAAVTSMPFGTAHSISVKEMYDQQQMHQALSFVAGGTSPEMPSPDTPAAAFDIQVGSCSDILNAEASIADMGSTLPSVLPFVNAAPNFSGDEFGLQGSLYSELPSVGSAAHFEGWCKPCAFAYEGCVNGSACEFCHICPPGELKARKRAKLAHRRKMNRFAQHNSQWMGK